jgi:integrase
MAKRKSSKRAITDAEVAAHKYIEGKSALLFDSGTGSVAGFYVRATPSGGKQYGIRYNFGGKRPTLSLGAVENWKCIADARAEATKKLRRLQQDGVDPAVGSSGTMAEVWRLYIEALRTGRGRRGKQRAGRPASTKSIIGAEHHWRNHLQPVVGALPPVKITSALVRQLHGDFSKPRRMKRNGRGALRTGGTTAANRAMESFRAAWKVGQAVGLTRGLPDPFDGYTPNAERVRKSYLRKDDAPKFLAAVEQEPRGFREFWKLAILLGCRTGELLAIEWRDVDLEGRRLTLRGIERRGTKSGDVNVLPLTTAAVAVLKSVPKADTRRVFPFSHPKSSWKRIMKRTHLDGLRPHDIRRSVGTWMGAAGMSSTQVGAVLGHKSDITSKVYIALGADDEAKLSALEAQAAAVKSLTAKVVNIEVARKQRTRRAARAAAL